MQAMALEQFIKVVDNQGGAGFQEACRPALSVHANHGMEVTCAARSNAGDGIFDHDHWEMVGDVGRFQHGGGITGGGDDGELKPAHLCKL